MKNAEKQSQVNFLLSLMEQLKQKKHKTQKKAFQANFFEAIE